MWRLIWTLIVVAVSGKIADRFVPHGGDYPTPWFLLGMREALILALPALLLGAWAGVRRAGRGAISVNLRREFPGSGQPITPALPVSPNAPGRCRQCGHALKPGNAFCTACGHPIG
jgi:hypothetical protein